MQERIDCEFRPLNQGEEGWWTTLKDKISYADHEPTPVTEEDCAELERLFPEMLEEETREHSFTADELFFWLKDVDDWEKLDEFLKSPYNELDTLANFCPELISRPGQNLIKAVNKKKEALHERDRQREAKKMQWRKL